MTYNYNKSKIKLHYFDEDRGSYLGSNSYIDTTQYIKSDKLIFDYLLNEIKLSDKSNLNLKFYFDRNSHEKFNNEGVVWWGKGVSLTKYNSFSLGSEFQFNYQPNKSHTIVSGLQLEYLKLYNYEFLTNFRKPYDPFFKLYLFGAALDNAQGPYTLSNWHSLEFPQNNKRTILGLFIQDEWKIHSKFLTTLGMRFDKYSDFGNTFNPKIGAVSPILDNLSIKAAYATAFRAPTFEELYDKSQISRKNGSNGNPNLKPEKIKTIELGIEYSPVKKLQYKINLFSNKIEDNIIPQNINKNSGASGVYDVYENIYGIDVKGLESEIKYDFDLQNYTFFNYSYFETVNKGGYIVAMGANGPIRTAYESYMMEVPQIRLNFGINFDGTLFGLFASDKCKYFALNSTYNYGSERYNNMVDIIPASGTSYSNMNGRRWKIPAYHIINLAFRTTDSFSKTVSIQFSVFNITDEPVYDNHIDARIVAKTGIDNTEEKIFPLQGRYFKSSVTIKF